ncbi:MAG: hypothetical protein Q8R30_01685 [bacterium]|nr:hypothetical protein [bacterium]
MIITYAAGKGKTQTKIPTQNRWELLSALRGREFFSPGIRTCFAWLMPPPKPAASKT